MNEIYWIGLMYHDLLIRKRELNWEKFINDSGVSGWIKYCDPLVFTPPPPCVDLKSPYSMRAFLLVL